jgi:hypothetical protein
MRRLNEEAARFRLLLALRRQLLRMTIRRSRTEETALALRSEEKSLWLEIQGLEMDDILNDVVRQAFILNGHRVRARESKTWSHSGYGRVPLCGVESSAESGKHMSHR